MDFGFVKSSAKDGEEKIQTSFDGYNSYPLITDEYFRYLWVFLTKPKQALAEIINMFLRQHGNSTGMQRVRLDLGRELARSNAVRNAITKNGHVLETTSIAAPFVSL